MNDVFLEENVMRTTLAIDDDVHAAAKSLAARQRKTLGEIVSELARQGLKPARAVSQLRKRNSIPLLSGRSGSPPVTPELVARLRDGKL
ncbi:MAG TPA: hypothetical protein VII49_09185 [Rhizomicrobium sp.]